MIEDGDALIYTVRPGGTSLWLPVWLAAQLKISPNSWLTEAQFRRPEITRLLEDRIKAERGRKPAEALV